MSVIPTLSVTQQAEVIARLLQQLQRLDDLTPGRAVNQAFSELVATAKQQVAPDFAEKVLRELGSDLISLQSLCAYGESALEAYWAKEIGKSPEPATRLEDFPYIEEYRELVRRELELLAPWLKRAEARVVFIGSGPLPLTAYLMAAEHSIQVDMVDSCMNAHTCAVGWLNRMEGVRGKIGCLHQDVHQTGSLAQYDAVMLAALVGTNSLEKADVVKSLALKMAPRQPLLLRTAEGLRQILYPSVDEQAGLPGFSLQGRISGDERAVNGVLLATRNDDPV